MKNSRRVIYAATIGPFFVLARTPGKAGGFGWFVWFGFVFCFFFSNLVVEIL